MELTVSFPREKPFGADVPFEALERYRDALADELRSQYPDWRVEVDVLDTGLGDVELEPDAALTSDERLRIALDVKRVAHRLADTMLAGTVAGGATNVEDRD